MATLSEYFDTESRDRLAEIERALDRQPLDPGELHRAARALRGSAQMAREERVFRASSALEAAARSLAASALSFSDDVAGRARETIADLRALIEREEEDTQLEDRARSTVERWASMGVQVAALSAAPAPQSSGDGSSEFREFAAREVAGIADALDRGVQQLAAEPMDREQLRMILRRQRALLGAARLDEIPVVAEILRAVEDLTRVIAKLDVGVKQEWLDIYRVAREGLKATIEPLHRNEDPQPSHALSRLRHMREELLERYGTGEAVSAAHENSGLVQAAPMTEPPAPVAMPEPDLTSASDDEDGGVLELGADDIVATADGAVDSDLDDDAPDLLAAAAGAMQRAAAAAAPVVASAAGVAGAVSSVLGQVAERAADAAGADVDAVPIQDLFYRGDAAVARADELRAAINRVAAHDPEARDAVEELFDLIRIAHE
jgi:HPt (histidine-containing phosphotransfer) domain-containing protein